MCNLLLLRRAHDYEAESEWAHFLDKTQALFDGEGVFDKSHRGLVMPQVLQSVEPYESLGLKRRSPYEYQAIGRRHHAIQQVREEVRARTDRQAETSGDAQEVG